MPSSRLLESSDLVRQIDLALSEANGEILLVSAYLKLEAVRWLINMLPPNAQIKVLARWRKSDLVSGSSDLEVYKLLSKGGHRFYIDNQVHTKVMVIDEHVMFIGSSNYTSSGLHLFGSGNKELNIMVQPTRSEVDRVEKYFSEAYEMNDPMYQFMKAEIETESKDESVDNNQNSWSEEIARCIKPIVDKLWVSECLYLSSNQFGCFGDDRQEHDESLWDGKPTRAKAKSMRLFLWLEHQLKTVPRNLKFGEVSYLLHDSLINEPAPYRKDVKVLVSNLFTWVEEFGLYEVEQPRYSKQIVNPYA